MKILKKWLIVIQVDFEEYERKDENVDWTYEMMQREALVKVLRLG